MRERFIIHFNVADFAAAVERVVTPRLRERPLVIASEGTPRAVVYDMSEDAYRNGVRKKMPLRQALGRCPGAAVLSPNPNRYKRAMEAFLEHALPYSPRIEVTDTRGHLFLDVTGTGRLFGPPPDVAWRIRKQVRAAMGLDPIWSVAPNKLTAKVATRMVKPAGEYIIGAGEEDAFLAPLPLHLLPGIEPGDLKRFSDFNLTVVQEASPLSKDHLAVLFGPRGTAIHDALRGIDPSPVHPFTQAPPAAAADHVFGEDTNTRAFLETALFQLMEQVGRDLRKQGLAAGRIRVTLGYSDGIQATRHAPVSPASANELHLFPAAAALFERLWTRRVRVRRLAVTCDQLTYPPPVQQDLFTFGPNMPKEVSRDRLIPVMDAVRNRFGKEALRFGRMLAA